MRNGRKETPSAWGTQGIVPGSSIWSPEAAQFHGGKHLVNVHDDRSLLCHEKCFWDTPKSTARTRGP